MVQDELRVLELLGPAWVQDRGAPAASAMGLPAGGALVPEALALANLQLGNPPETAGIEFFGSLRVETVRPLATPEGSVRSAQMLRCHRKVSYLAVKGGIDTPIFLGSRGWRVGFGTRLEPGLVLPLGEQGQSSPPGRRQPVAPQGLWAPDRAIRLVPGPDPCILSLLCGPQWRVGEGDRTGLRLEGVPMPAGEGHGASAPMLPGAIQLPPNGLPIILGPDHPVTGGYRLIATVIQADLGALFGRLPGESLRLLPVDPSLGRALWRQHPLLGGTPLS